MRRREDKDAPLALLTGPAQRRTVQAVNAAARALGIRPGQTLAAAQTLARGFVTADYDPAQIEHWHRFLASWAYRYSAQVSLHYPRCLLLEVDSCLGLFGPWPQFEVRLRQELSDLGFAHRIALAPNPAAARVLVNARDGLVARDTQSLIQQLEPLPIDRLGLPTEDKTAFQRMGIRRLHQVLDLPRESVAKRFAPQVLEQLDRIMGRLALPLEFYLPPDFFDGRIEFNYEVESHQALLFPLRRLTADLSVFLTGRDRGVQHFCLHLEHRTTPDTQVSVGLLNPERDAGILFELTRGRLERQQLPSPVLALRLVAQQLPAFSPQHQQLFDERVQVKQSWQLLQEQLRMRLGDEAIYGLGVNLDHRPERAWVLEPNSLQMPGKSPRPGWLLSNPLPLSETSVRILAGPERIESGWWDGADIRRDYYVIETAQGQRGWAFRTLGAPSALMLHGWFA